VKILIISPEPWDTNQVSKHHYARTLARRGHKIFFLDPPIETNSGISIERVAQEQGEISVVHGPRVAPGLRLMPAALRRALERRWLRHLERVGGVRIDVIWLFENSRFYDMTFAGDRLKIYHQVDLIQDFHVAEASSSADICFAVSDTIVDRVARHARTVHKIAHGVLTTMPAVQTAQPSRIRRGRQAAAYIGNLDRVCIDLDLLVEVIAGSPEVDFHMIGSYEVDGRFHKRLGEMSNVILWGRLPSASLPSALAAMDALMIVYDTADFRDHVASPHKLMEYLASGKVTVATYNEECAALADGSIIMVKDPRDYAETFRTVMADLDRWNAPELQAKRIAIARENTYDRQIDRISEALSASPAIRARFGAIRL